MAYQVLARKLRPQNFAELIGQAHVATTLLNALKSSRMPHALLFTGARGVGKTSAARILAKSLRCPNVKDFVPCNKCVDCEEITQGRAVDVIEIDGASNNGVENVRELRETVGYMPSRGKYKVYIIDEVHMLSTSAFNALLKTLEEPPPHVVFIFATTEAQKIPVTVLSRCQRFDFRRIPIRQVADKLKAIIEDEKIQAESQALWLVARESEGSMRDSLSLLEQVITFCGKKITHAQVVDILGLTDRTLLSTTLQALINRDASTCLQVIEKVFFQGYDPKQFAQDLLEHLRNLMIVKVSLEQKGIAPTEFLDLPDQEIDELKKTSEKLSNEDVHMLFDMTLKGVGDVLRAVDPRIVLEMLLLRLSQAPRLTSIEKLIGQIGSGGISIEISKKKPVVVEKETYNTSSEWKDIVEKIKKEKPLLGAKLEYASLLKSENDKYTVNYKKDQEFFHSQVATPEIVKQLNELITQFLGKPAQVEFTLGAQNATSTLSPREAQDKAETAAKEQVKARIDSHPLIQETKNIFNARTTVIKELNP